VASNRETALLVVPIKSAPSSWVRAFRDRAVIMTKTKTRPWDAAEHLETESVTSTFDQTKEALISLPVNKSVWWLQKNQVIHF
jgi:hypothetical protein